jgi:hypothetical protein
MVLEVPTFVEVVRLLADSVAFVIPVGFGEGGHWQWKKP